VRLRSGLIQRAAVATISFPRPVGAAKPPTTKVVPAGHGRLFLVVAILGLLAAAALLRLLFRRPRGRGEQPIAPQVRARTSSG
jgi:hypothetical protein